MTSSIEQQITILNGLIETTLDSAYGYKEAAGDAKNLAFKHLFEGRWLQRKQLTTELQSEVRSLGGTPDDDGTMLAAARCIFINLRNTMAGSDQKHHRRGRGRRGSHQGKVRDGAGRQRADIHRQTSSDAGLYVGQGRP